MNTVPARLAGVLEMDRGRIIAVQEQVCETLGRFVQHLRVHSAAGGPDGRTAGEMVAITALAPLDNKAVFEREVHQYTGPQGAGFTVFYFWTEGGREFTVSHHRGLESWRDVHNGVVYEMSEESFDSRL